MHQSDSEEGYKDNNDKSYELINKILNKRCLFLEVRLRKPPNGSQIMKHFGIVISFTKNASKYKDYLLPRRNLSAPCVHSKRIIWEP